MKNNNIQVIICKPGERAYVATINNNLESLQQIVGGYIEALYPFDDAVAIICNEEGKIYELELNRALRNEDGTIYDIVAGTFLIVGLDEDNFTFLKPTFLKKYSELFKYPEVFLHIGNTIIAIPNKSSDSDV